MLLALVALVLALLYPSPGACIAPPQNLRVVETGPGWARLRWDTVPSGALKGYRLKYSLTPGVHPSMTDWNGYEAAFTFTTDDGDDDNLTWARAFDRHNRNFTIFAIPARTGTPGYLSEEDLRSLNERGHEIGSHSYNHVVLIRNTAFTIRYWGPVFSCDLSIASDTLRTVLNGFVPDLAIPLTDPDVQYLSDLVETIDAVPYYSCDLDYYDCTNEFCQSIYLEDAGPVDIAHEPYQAITARGSDSLTLAAEVTDSKAFFEGVIEDTNYVCRSLAYPRHAHDQREMNAVMEAGYAGARNGALGPPPSLSPTNLNYLDRVSLYQAPTTWGQPWNDSSETASRQMIRSRIAAWKQDHEWAIPYLAHTLADWDSAHVDWVVDELVADGGVWVAPFGTIAEYVRQFHVTVENPVEPGRHGFTASAPLRGLPEGPWIYVVAVAYDTAGNESAWSNEVSFRAGQSEVAVPGTGPVVRLPFVLGNARPNPMNPAATIPFRIEEESDVSLRIYDIEGRIVSTLLDGRVRPGVYEYVWDGRESSGKPAAAGHYFCRLATPVGNEAKRIDLIR
jgi:hypothetical protein